MQGNSFPLYIISKKKRKKETLENIENIVSSELDAQIWIVERCRADRQAQPPQLANPDENCPSHNPSNE